MSRTKASPERLAEIRRLVDEERAQELTERGVEFLMKGPVKARPAVKTIDARSIASEPPPKKRKLGDSSAAVQRYYDEALALNQRAGDTRDPMLVWSGAKVEHMVGLYAAMHERVYGALPIELNHDWLAATSAARKMLREEFGESPALMAEYLRWSFAREKKREGRRQFAEKSGSGWRVGWRYAFVQRSMLTDYRVEVKRLEKARK